MKKTMMPFYFYVYDFMRLSSLHVSISIVN